MRKLRFSLFTAGFVLPALALTVLIACADGTVAGGATLGSKPDFRLQTMDGRVIGPVDFPGKVVVVDFWATWCGPCQIQSMILDSIVKGMSDKPVVFLSADVGETKETVRSFMKANPHVGIPVLLDPESKVSDALGVQGLPTLMVVDRKGRVMAFHTGLTDAETLQRIIRQASL